MEQNSQNNQNNITSINQLPNNPAINNQNMQVQQMPNQANQNNIALTKNEIINDSTSQNQMPQIDSNLNNNIVQNNVNYNELIGQLQKASSNGATALPSRDIPMDQSQQANDNNVKPNYIPEPPTNEDYINNMQTPDYLINENNKNTQKENNLEHFYSEIQIPLLFGLLYFIFQLPAFKILIKRLLPYLFSSDGNMNLYGHIFKSALFSSIFYIIFKTMNILTYQFNYF